MGDLYGSTEEILQAKSSAQESGWTPSTKTRLRSHNEKQLYTNLGRDNALASHLLLVLSSFSLVLACSVSDFLSTITPPLRLSHTCCRPNSTHAARLLLPCYIFFLEFSSSSLDSIAPDRRPSLLHTSTARLKISDYSVWCRPSADRFCSPRPTWTGSTLDRIPSHLPLAPLHHAIKIILASRSL